MPVSRKDGWKIALAYPGSEEVLWFNKPAVFLHGQFLTKVHDKEEAMTLRVSRLRRSVPTGWLSVSGRTQMPLVVMGPSSGNGLVTVIAVPCTLKFRSRVSVRSAVRSTRCPDQT